ncbi:MAG: hypothetical protein K2H48_08790 [Duncaniella sp.]|nr:hypothetical protein [Duncaniella sp.]
MVILSPQSRTIYLRKYLLTPYSLTSMGESAIPPVMQMGHWGESVGSYNG